MKGVGEAPRRGWPWPDSRASLDGDHGCRSHPERELAIGFVEEDTDRESLREPDPVERRFDLGHALERSSALVEYRPADALDLPCEAPARRTRQEDLRLHARSDVAYELLAEVRHHVPGSIIDQRHDRVSGARHLADCRVEVGDIAIEGGHDAAVVEIQLRVFYGRLGVLDSSVGSADLAERTPCLREVRASALHRGVGGGEAAARLEDLVLGDELLRQQRLYTVQVLPRVRCVGLPSAQRCLRGSDTVLKGADLDACEIELRLCLVQGALVGPGVDDEKELPLLDALVAGDCNV